MKIAFGLHLLAALLIAAAGLVYLFRSEFRPYHAEAVGPSWSEVERPFQILIRTLMIVLGGACLATSSAVITDPKSAS
jgi:hypothetical protein